MKSAPPLRVLIVDDHRHVHEIITKIFEKAQDIAVVGQASNGEEAIHACEESHPDVILMDVVMPIMDGLQATKAIHARFPDVKILVLSSFQDHDSVRALLKSGAVGYVTKTALTDELLNVIRITAKGEAVLSPEAMQNLVNPREEQTIYRFNLTDRELEVLVLLAEGLTNQQSADKLSISQSTLKFHMNNIFQKLGVQTRSEALVLAAKNNLI